MYKNWIKSSKDDLIMPKKCRTARKIKRCKPLDEELLKA